MNFGTCLPDVLETPN